jgi:hypothetical protein
LNLGQTEPGQYTITLKTSDTIGGQTHESHHTFSVE